MIYKRRAVAITGWEMYECDTKGNIYGKNGRTKLKYSLNHGGYCIVNFYHNGVRKGFAVHTIIAKTFIPNIENKTQVNHIDGNKQNNCVENLEWVTELENVSHARKVLGFDNSGINNINHKIVYGYDIKTHELKYRFDSVMDAAVYFSPNNKEKAQHIQNIISRVALGKKLSYKGCKWSYNKLE